MQQWPLFLLFACAAAAQQNPSAVPPVNTIVVVLGNPIAVSHEDSARSVVTLDTQKHPLAYQDVEDYLRTDASVDIQQRGAAGVMSDISVRGASFEQTLVLVNGLRMDNAETAHFNLDLPVPRVALGRMDILHGAGSTLYGSDAIGGVVDFITWKPDASTLRLRAGTGSYGENEQGMLASAVGRKWNEVLVGDRAFSTGFINGRDYRTEDASNETRLDTALGSTDVLLAGDDRSYGANQFYGPYNSWERTKGWFTSLTQQFDPHIQADVAYRRHSDIYLLERDEPTGYKNQHVDDGFEGALRDQREIAKDLSLSSGLEETADRITSTNLGQHARNRGAGYAAVEWMKPAYGSLSIGGREEVFSGGPSVFSPTAAVTRWVSSTATLHASVGYGFRIPTYLDLYYSDPTTIGNPNLKPESAWSYEGGLNWYPTPRVATTLTAFLSSQKNTIDYTRVSSAEPWQASNLPGLHFTGVEAAVEWAPDHGPQAKLSWTNLTGVQAALQGLESEYVFNYPVNNGRAECTWDLAKQLIWHTRLGVVQRYQKSPYAVWDVSLVRERGFLHPYLQLTNLTNTGYEEIAGVRMPGRSFVGGLEVTLLKRK